MTAPIPVAFHWSGGKDSAHGLGRLLKDDRYEVRCLVTTIDDSRGESSVHRLPKRVLQAQADAVGLPLHTVALAGPGLDDYVEVMGVAARRLRDAGIRAFAFGDLEHSDGLVYRQEQFEPLGIAVVEPLWGMTSQQCMIDFLRSKIDALTVVVDAAILGREHLGVVLDRAFVDTLPPGCDPCGETGEYHTFVWDAPYFRRPVTFTTGQVERIQRRIGTRHGIRMFEYWQLPVH